MKVDQALRDAGLRPTRQRLSVLEFLRNRPDAVTAQDLHAELRRAGASVGLTTVYRTLTSLAEAGLLDVFARDGEQAFRRCGDMHHHHLVCETCNKVEELLSRRWRPGSTRPPTGTASRSRGTGPTSSASAPNVADSVRAGKPLGLDGYRRRRDLGTLGILAVHDRVGGCVLTACQQQERQRQRADRT